MGALDGIAQLAQELNNGGPQSGPLTGEDFATWADRLRTVEQLVDDPNLRQQLNNARTQAEDMRRTFQTHTVAPRWNEVQNKILTPLISVQAQLRAQLARAEQPDTLQPADRDPVPEKYADSVRSYYELLGSK